jgi:hypothetical protein
MTAIINKMLLASLKRLYLNRKPLVKRVSKIQKQIQDSELEISQLKMDIAKIEEMMNSYLPDGSKWEDFLKEENENLEGTITDVSGLFEETVPCTSISEPIDASDIIYTL